MVGVNGTITFDGQPPPKSGSIIYNPVPGSGLEGLPMRPGRASFREDGKFVATSFQEGDGLLPGRYRVKVTCVDGIPDQQRSYDDISLVPSGWAPEDLVVEEGQSSISVNYDVPPKT